MTAPFARLERSPDTRYTGPLKAVVLDWAGTAVDHGCRAPTSVFMKVFADREVEVTVEQAREPMGTHKREHIRLMCAMPGIASTWRAVHGRDVTEADQDAMYAELTPKLVEILPAHSEPIPGLLPTIEALRARGLGVGSTTGYIPEMLAVVREIAATKGYSPDVAVSAGEVPAGRPAPYLCWEAVRRLGVLGDEGAAACVKIGDTPVDIRAGVNAGFWTIGTAVSGNEIGLSAAEWAALSAAEQAPLRARAVARLESAGAHYIVDSVADILPVLDDIEARLAEGDRP